MELFIAETQGTRQADLVIGNRIIAQWTHPSHPGRVFNTSRAIYAQQKLETKKGEIHNATDTQI